MTALIPHLKKSYSLKVRRPKKDLKKLLNLNFMSVTNKTYYCGKYDMPYILSELQEYPDYIALYNETGKYHLTNNTCVAFYQYDNVYDDLYGIFNAIYYNDEELLKYYKQRFTGVNCFIGVDYSQCGDVPCIENMYRQFKSRVVAIWLTMELGSIVIPNITYANVLSFKDMLCGMENCKTVAFSTKGVIGRKNHYELAKQAIAYVTDNLNLKDIIVYSVCSDNRPVYDLFDYAIAKNINIIIPDNTLQLRNRRIKQQGVV